MMRTLIQVTCEHIDPDETAHTCPTTSTYPRSSDARQPRKEPTMNIPSEEEARRRYEERRAVCKAAAELRELAAAIETLNAPDDASSLTDQEDTPMTPTTQTGPRTYVKKPVAIEAIRYQPGPGGNCEAVAAFMGEGIVHDDADCDPDTEWIIPTLEGEMVASPGDWIIRGEQGEFFPCKPDIFEATYEVAS